MSRDEIREVVRATIEELLVGGLIETNYSLIKKAVEPLLRSYFTGSDNTLSKPLQTLSADPYIDVILYYYRDGMTLEEIAEELDKDTSTISRHRQRLLTNIYRLINE